MCLKAALEDGQKAQDCAIFQVRSVAVQIEPELVGGELVAGHLVGLEASHLGVGFAEILVTLLEERLKVGYCLSEIKDGRFE